jgi:hypothetical protein
LLGRCSALVGEDDPEVSERRLNGAEDDGHLSMTRIQRQAFLPCLVAENDLFLAPSTITNTWHDQTNSAFLKYRPLSTTSPRRSWHREFKSRVANVFKLARICDKFWSLLVSIA